MNTRYLGDSFDIVKRFLCETLRGLGYEVFIDPMFTGTWEKEELAFYRLLGVEHIREWTSAKSPSALLLDPDTGVNEKGGETHVAFDRIDSEAHAHEIVFAFDQSFSRQANTPALIQKILKKKLKILISRGCHGFYCNSHARFLFAARDAHRLTALTERLQELGLPASNLVPYIQRIAKPKVNGGL
jgi:hypothetical protein